MSLILEAGEICPHSSNCPYNKENECWGARTDRTLKFNCSFVKNGKIIEGVTRNRLDQITRNRLDQTGQMKILIE